MPNEPVVISVPGGEDLGPWVPTVGKYTGAFRAHMQTRSKSPVETSAMQIVIDEAREILGHCRTPSDPPGQGAVLVVGQVQSGKTLSFTTVASLARDNRFGLVILLAGTKDNLRSQSEVRLIKDLQLGTLESRNSWRHYSNPDSGKAAAIQQDIDNWRKSDRREIQRERPAVLITVLKQYQRVGNLASLLGSLNLENVPALVIDDEADQASINTKTRVNLTRGSALKSGTYASVTDLRGALPQHSYLQYTATPQANLLMAISDELNPSYAKVISSGASYTGGQYFFVNHRDSAVVELPISDIFDPNSPLDLPPKSLQDALRTFLISAAVVDLADLSANRSMMIQASQSRGPHARYKRWVTNLLIGWSDLAQAGGEALAELRDDFLPVYEAIKQTTAEIPTLDEILAVLPEVCDEIRVAEVNTGGTEVDWDADRFWILIGGLKLDRGFTVEGLVSTYVPRNSPGSVDVLQQRARFFGYRLGYAGHCRLYMPASMAESYGSYVEGEKFLHASLKDSEGKPLRDWKRAFLLSKGIRSLARASVVGKRIRRVRLDGGWIFPKDLNLGPDQIIENRAIFSKFFDVVSFGRAVESAEVLAGVVDRRQDAPENFVVRDVGSDELLKFLLSIDFQSSADKALITSLSSLLSQEDLDVDVVSIGGLSTRGQRGRTLSALRSNPFVGKAPKNPTSNSPLTYSGDRSIRDPNKITLQLRTLILNSGPGVDDSVRSNVPWLTVFIPQPLRNDLVVEVF